MNVVEQLILQAFEHVDKDYVSGKLGSKFLEMLARDRQKKQGKEEEFLSEEDEIYVKKVRFLTECEKVNDLGWLDHSSWNTFTPDFRNLFERLVDPLFSGSGYYFKYSAFFENARALISKQHFDSVIYVLRDGAGYFVVCISASSKQYNWMGSQNFDKTLVRFQEQVCVSMANSSQGPIIKHTVVKPGENMDVNQESR